MNASLQLPVIDLSSLRDGPDARRQLAQDLDAACRQFGFFYLTGHGVRAARVQALMESARAAREESVPRNA